jgi:predicted Zn-dependent protease
MLFTALGLLVAAARLGQGAEAAATSSAEEATARPAARWRQPRVATPVVAGIVLVAAALFAFTPLGASAYLNLGSVERARAELPDEISPDERDRRLARAEAFLRQGLAVDEGDPALWRGLAEVAIARDDDAEAERLLRRAAEHTPAGDGYGWFQIGRLYREAGLWRETIRSWREAGADDALRAMAADFRERGQWDRASTTLLALIELRPSDARAYREYAEAASASPLGREGAIAELERLGQQATRSPWPHVERAILYEALGRKDEAEAARRQAAALGAPDGRR